MSSCLLCGAERVTPLFVTWDRVYRAAPTPFPVVQCASCGLIRRDPQPTPEEVRRYYSEGYWYTPEGSAASALEETYRRLVLRDHVRFVSEALRRSRARGPLLDIGCSGGLFLSLMRERGIPVVGLDFSSDAAAIAWGRHAVPAVCGVLEHAPLREDSFAGVTMFHVLEHLHDPRAYLIAAHRLLQREGRLVIQVPNAASWQFHLLGRRWNGAADPRHLFDFRDSDVERLVESCGFEVVRRKYFSLRDNPAGLATSLAPGLDPMGRRVRRLRESAAARLGKDLAYFALVVASVAFAAAEASFHAGSTVMLEARKR